MNYFRSMTSLVILFSISTFAFSDGKTKAAREAAEYLIARFGKEVGKDGLETLAKRLEVLAVKHGDEVYDVAKKLGPRTIRIVEEAGENGTKVVKLMAKYGDGAVVWVISRPNGMAIFLKYGDEAAETLIKHPAISEPVIESLGMSSIQALKSVSSDNARRIQMMMLDGELTKIGRTPEILNTVGKYGDRAMNFIWSNKGSLAVSAALAAFLVDPVPFIDGTKDIAKLAAENIAKPIATEAAKGVNWTLLLICVAIPLVLLAALKEWNKHRIQRKATPI